jgi:hypothetical protein
MPSERTRRTKMPSVTSIPIVDQITRELLPTTGRCQLVGNPFRRWVCGNAEPEDLSSAVAHDQQPIEHRNAMVGATDITPQSIVGFYVRAFPRWNLKRFGSKADVRT